MESSLHVRGSEGSAVFHEDGYQAWPKLTPKAPYSVRCAATTPEPPSPPPRPPLENSGPGL